MGRQPSLIGSLHRLRRRVGLKRSLLPTAVNRGIDGRRLSRRMQDGLPEGLDEGLLVAVTERENGSGPVAVRHAPLQRWKVTSANHVWMRLDDGTTWTLVFKDARFGHDDYPAISGLPIEPGVAEYSLYAHMTPGMQRFVPRIYSVSELEGGKHYQYVMEDLRSRYHPVYRNRDKVALLNTVAHVHDALRDWVTAHGTESLISYDRSYVAELITHAEAGLDLFAGMGGRATAEQVAAIWPDVVAYLSAERNLSRRRLRPIHGDLNTKNTFVSNSGGDDVRIVDWEWSGVGTVHDDFASLLKRRDRKLDEQALRILGQIEPELDEQDHLEMLWWSRLATAVLDASLLSHQLAGLGSPSEVVADRTFGLWRALLVKQAQLEEVLSAARKKASDP